MSILVPSKRFFNCLGLLLVIPWMLFTKALVAPPPPRQSLQARHSIAARISSFMSKTTNEEKDTPVSKWEKMYYEGEQREAEQAQQLKALPKSEVRVITFDLDNTVWKTTPTIAAANDALAEFLDRSNIHQPIRVEKVMGELFQVSKPRYCPLMEQDTKEKDAPPDEPKAPVLLTLLRKDAIQYILEEHNDFSEEESMSLADEAFHVWTRARHDVIPSFLASNAKECLEKLKSSITGSSGNPVLIGAITDGNSSPQTVEGLGEYFDFCINAESVGVAKPDNRVYVKAMRTVGQHPHVQDLFGSLLQENKLTPEVLQEMVGPWWVHVGDDFAKDVVAAKGLNMRSVWSRELINVPKATETEDKDKAPSKSVEEFVKEISEMKEIKMGIGAGDYLEDAIHREFADAIIDSFEELSNLLLDWHQEGLNSLQESTIVEAALVQESDDESYVEKKTPMNGILEVIEPAARNEPAEEAKKFCVFCGTKLPVDAKFCLSCGEKQPQID